MKGIFGALISRQMRGDAGRRRGRGLLTTAVLPALLALLLASLSGCGGEKTANAAERREDSRPMLPVTRLVAHDTTLTRDYVASIEALRNVEIRSRVAGYLTAIRVDEGKRVTKGQVLFQLNDAVLRTQLQKMRAAVNNAAAQVRVAELELSRVRLLTEKKIISQTELEVGNAKLAAARANEAEARANEEAAELNLAYAQIRAPFDGVVDRIPLREGSEVEDGTLLTSISDTRAAYAYFTVSETEYLQYARQLGRDSTHADRAAHLLLADGSAYRQPGHVETVQGEFEGTTGSIAFRARFPNPDRLLRHGATGKVRLINPLPDALLIPQTAVFEVQDHDYVYVVDAKGIVRQRAFVPQTRLGTCYVVGSGLKAGDAVVCEGTQSLRDGDAIRPRFVPLPVEPTARGGSGGGTIVAEP